MHMETRYAVEWKLIFGFIRGFWCCWEDSRYPGIIWSLMMAVDMPTCSRYKFAQTQLSSVGTSNSLGAYARTHLQGYPPSIPANSPLDLDVELISFRQRAAWRKPLIQHPGNQWGIIRRGILWANHLMLRRMLWHPQAYQRGRTFPALKQVNASLVSYLPLSFDDFGSDFSILFVIQRPLIYHLRNWSFHTHLHFSELLF